MDWQGAESDGDLELVRLIVDEANGNLSYMCMDLAAEI